MTIQIKKVFLVSLIAVLLSVLSVATVSAHVVVRPAEVETASRLTFSVSVPNERDVPVVGVRLEIPDGLRSVRPNAKAGWDIAVSTTGEGEDVSATEITWTGGEIPVDLKDDFLFSAMAPAEATELQWKAYETYADGTVVAWDQEPGGSKPYSVTRVVAETTSSDSSSAEQAAADANKAAQRALYVGIVAVVLGLAGIALALRKS